MALTDQERLRLLQLRKKKALAQQAAMRSATQLQSQPQPQPNEFAIGPEGIDIQRAAQIATTPIRGFRGLGVGAERLLYGDPLSVVAERAAAAVEPGFQPREGERAGVIGGEFLATAPLFNAAAPASAPLWAQSLGSAVAGGTLTAINDAADRGDVEPIGAAFSTAVGAAVPFLGPTVRVVARAIRGAGKVGATLGTTLRRESVETIFENPNLLEQTKGTAKEVSRRVGNIQRALLSLKDRAGSVLKRARAKIGMQEELLLPGQRVTEKRFVVRKLPDLLDEFNLLTGRESKTAFPAAGRSKTAADAKLRRLIKLRQELQDHVTLGKTRPDVAPITSTNEALLKKMVADINEEILHTPGGVVQRGADKVWSGFRDLYDGFQRDISTQGKAEDLIQRIIRSKRPGSIDEIIGKKGQLVKTLRKLEKSGGRPLIQPLEEELAAKALREVEPGGIFSTIGIVPTSLTPEGVASALTGIRRASDVTHFVGNKLGSPVTRGLIQAGQESGLRGARRSASGDIIQAGRGRNGRR